MKQFSRITAALVALFISLTAAAQYNGGMMVRGGHGGSGMGMPPQGPGGRGMGGPNQSRGFIFGSVFLSPDEEGGVEVAGVGVTVTVITMKEGAEGKMKALDTLYTTVNDRGFFNFRNVRVGKAYVRFSMVGYEEEAKVISISPGENKLLANLKPQHEALEAAVVKEKVAPMSVKGDTIIFNAAAVKTNKGEMAIDILEQMPGVTVDESSVSILNEEVKNVYVDGALLFGKAPMKALNNIPAEEVTTIKSYQEYANKDPFHKTSKNEDKERVIDIQTKSKPKYVVGVDFLSGGGYDTDSTYHKPRYTIGGEVNASSEKLQVSARANLNNINNSETRQRGSSFRTAKSGGSADLRSATASVSVNRRWMSPSTRNFELGSLGASYSYSDNYDVTESITEKIFFPTAKYESRRQESTSKTETGSKVHSVSVNAGKSLRDGHIGLSAGFSATDNSTLTYSSSYNYQDALSPQGTSTSKDAFSDARSYSASLSASKGFFDKLRLNAQGTFSAGPTNGTTTKIDTTTSTITRTVLDISDDRTSRKLNATLGLRYELSERSSAFVTYHINDSHTERLQWAYDVTDPATQIVDTVNTQLRTDDGIRQTAKAGYRTAFADDNVTLDASLAFTTYSMNRVDDFPTRDDYSHRFNSVLPQLTITNKSQLDHFMFGYTASDDTPSVQQVRAKINNSNLYNVSAGNPALRHSLTHAVNFSFSTVLGRESRETMREMEEARRDGGRMRQRNMSANLTSFMVNLSFKATNDVIASRKIYYTESTYLPEYGYTMPAQSTFSTYVNAGSSYSALANASFSTPVKWLGSNVSAGVSYNWDSTPSYVDGVLTTTVNSRPSMNIGLRSTFSRNIRFNLNGNASYVHSATSTGGSKDYFTEVVRAGVELNNIFKHGYAGGNYMKSFTQGIAYTNVNDNILDLKAGMKFGPRNNYDVYVTVHDLFNRTSGFSTSTQQDYISNVWKHQFGRYIMFSFAYRFNSFGKRRSGGGSDGPGMGPGGFGGPGMGGPGMGGMRGGF